MKWTIAFVLACVACERPAPEAVPPPAPTSSPAATADACRRDIPDCAAACALRETGRLDHIDWFDRRCAAVVLGKNPDKVVGPPDAVVAVAPTGVTTTTAAVATVAPTPSGSTVAVVRPEVKPPFDPFATQRRDATDPPECVAARRLIARGLARDAQALAALCEAKGGDAGAPYPKNLDGDDPFASRH